MSRTTPAPWRREPGLVGRTVEAFLSPLQDAYLRDTPSAVARLAQLRRGAGKAPEEVPELYGLTGTEGLYAQGPFADEKTEQRATVAVHTAVTLYALHQQSQRSRRMHRTGYELGAAVRMLMPSGEIDEPLRRRFVRVGTATSEAIRADRLRELVLLLRRQEVPLDYAFLADQLAQVQVPQLAPRVRQQWGRGFHAWRPPKATDSDGGGSKGTDTSRDAG
ncbi:type I-E CRISPR-associated protein Cse2/CasB [Streptomyces alkaliterrae]|uniref:Type I-E CRISPR-associated protein Cse2/CasB n=1 Tax=Streptomyces alkaliterrae TaxID=2213162 RepID=A0A5P0YV35_9ACTN|nr:type I-E CRISPR-associated protein Cse2/CasB [Streptomyces alkaliterrae]MBB1255661.1 type I-E CRISPR-associated protein Cse2/CasB [Streptomyces alkaliterrae]MBB1261794.1 type I-E CRISPR-associated protein Cse2/CasB [Streptomyces alkaliterrae]MQS04156.1 type I-E CRISPR-associated protein Cse2/CasB [Streptomyces alkaliterrae]